MSLRFHYKLHATKSPVVSLDGRLVRPRPLIAISVIGPSATTVEMAYVDTLSDDCVFPAKLAGKIGVDLADAPHGEAVGVGQKPLLLRYARITFRLASGDAHCEWPAWVAFADAELKRPLLGFAGFLQFFTATFHGDREELELYCNSDYPGSML